MSVSNILPQVPGIRNALRASIGAFFASVCAGNYIESRWGNAARRLSTEHRGNEPVMTVTLILHGRSCSASLRNSLVARHVLVSQLHPVGAAGASLPTAWPRHSPSP